MGVCYVSPIPAEFRLDYRVRDIEGNATWRRVHLWPMPDGGVMLCNPALCRECERERSWHDHGHSEGAE